MYSKSVTNLTLHLSRHCLSHFDGLVGIAPLGGNAMSSHRKDEGLVVGSGGLLNVSQRS